MRFTRREKIFLGCILVLVAVVCGLIYTGREEKNKVDISLEEEGSFTEDSHLIQEDPNALTSKSQETEMEIAVYMTGEVAKPGVYQVLSSARVEDLLSLAGGPTDAADLTQVNLARHPSDEEMIVIPKQGETVPNVQTRYGGEVFESTGVGADSRININTATAEQLNTLPGIGPAYAQRIIDYRTKNGKFNRIEDIQNVSGIGTKTFEKLKDQISV